MTAAAVDRLLPASAFRDVSGVYVHVPFCAADCAYCVFSREVPADRSAVASYLIGLEREADYWRARAGAAIRPETVYVGGGTPTYLTPGEIRTFGHHLRRLVDVASVAEFTVEANPESVDEERLAAWVSLGATRVSIGAQSHAAGTLTLLGRTHDWRAVERAVAEARRHPLDVSVDLIYGVPGQGAGEWAASLAAVLALEPDHVSAYGLTFEEGSALSAKRAAGALAAVGDDAQRVAYDTLVAHAARASFDRYEISNFARAGKACRHNLGYWRRTPYLGLGPSAHGFLGHVRLRNHARRPRWEARLEAGEGPVAAVDVLDEGARVTESLMRLRTREGLPLSALPEPSPRFRARLDTLSDAGLLEREAGWVRLTESAFFLCDGITADLLSVWDEASAHAPRETG